MNKILKIVTVIIIAYSYCSLGQSNKIYGEILTNFNYTSFDYTNNNVTSFDYTNNNVTSFDYTNNNVTSSDYTNNVTSFTKIHLGYQEGNLCSENAQCNNQISEFICDKPVCIFSFKQIPFILALPF